MNHRKTITPDKKKKDKNSKRGKLVSENSFNEFDNPKRERQKERKLEMSNKTG